MKKILTILLLTIKNVFLFIGSIALLVFTGCIAFLPLMALFHVTSMTILGAIALAFLVWVAAGVAIDEYKMKHEHKGK